METISNLWFVLAGVLAMAGTQHMLVFVRCTGMRHHLWLGTIALAVAGAALAPAALGLPATVALPCIIVAVMLSAAGQLAGIVARGQQADQRQRQALAHAARLSIVGQLTASIAHQINQPLGSIFGNADAAEIMLEGARPPMDEIRRIVSDIRRDVLRASGVVRHVRSLVRNQDMASAQVDANALARDVVALLEPDASRRRIAVAVELAATSSQVCGNRALLEQALINLLSNAMDATETADLGEQPHSPRRPIQVVVAPTARGEVQITVVDPGHGIPVGQLEHLFTSCHTSKPHGMGLGLSIARSIAEAHGGRIRAENDPFAGARVSITLPTWRGASVPSSHDGGLARTATCGTLRSVEGDPWGGACPPTHPVTARPRQIHAGRGATWQ
ncbi:sensor histidine kinase [Luteimonas sp. A482]